MSASFAQTAKTLAADVRCRALDYMLGYLLFGGLFLLSFLGFVSRIQAALLFNVKFAKSLKRGRLLVSGACDTPYCRIGDVAVRVDKGLLCCTGAQAA